MFVSTITSIGFLILCVVKITTYLIMVIIHLINFLIGYLKFKLISRTEYFCFLLFYFIKKKIEIPRARLGLNLELKC